MSSTPAHTASACTSEYQYRFMLKPSSIHAAGVGCFATCAIPAGAQLSPGFDENFRRLPSESIPDEYLKYCVLLPEGLFLSPNNFLRMGVFWYINHAREPNLSFERQRLCARRPIQSGEELFLYYSDLLTHPRNKLWVQPSDIRSTPTVGGHDGRSERN